MEKEITITISNYNDQKVTFTLSVYAEIQSFISVEDSKVTGLTIDAYDRNILIEKEDLF